MSIFNLIINRDRKAPKEYNFIIKGDLHQMDIQASFLRKQGYDVKQRDVYPVLKESDAPTALRLILNNLIIGWWHYSEDYIKYNIVTKQEYDNICDSLL